jgi:hypothetical protein
MNILKIALLCSLRVAFFASLKVALLAYTLFLSDTAFASAVSEGYGNAGDTASCRTRGQWARRHTYSSPEENRHVGDTASFAAPEGNGHIDIP